MANLVPGRSDTIPQEQYIPGKQDLRWSDTVIPPAGMNWLKYWLTNAYAFQQERVKESAEYLKLHDKLIAVKAFILYN